MDYCYHCMTKLEEIDMPFCPECGSRHSVHEAKSYELPAGTTLYEGRYLVGKSIYSDSFSITYIGFDSKENTRVTITETFYRNVFKRTSKKDDRNSLSVSYGDEISYDVIVRNTRKECITLSDCVRLGNIAGVREWFSENNTVYVVSEYVDGETLFEHVKNNGAYSWEELYGYIEPVFRNLSQLHDKNIIHKNVSPHNIKLRNKENGECEFVLVNFGIAQPKETDSPVERETNAYSPNEQKKHTQPNGLYTDVFSCAATIYFAVSGEEPKNESDRETDYLFPLLKPFRKSGRLPDNIYYALKYALQPDYKARCQTLEEFTKRIYTDPGASKTVYITPAEGDVNIPGKPVSIEKEDIDGSAKTVYMPSDDDGSAKTVYVPSDDDGSAKTVYVPSDDDSSAKTVYVPSDDDGSAKTVYVPNDDTENLINEPIFLADSQSDSGETTVLSGIMGGLNEPAFLAEPQGAFGETTVLTGQLNPMDRPVNPSPNTPPDPKPSKFFDQKSAAPPMTREDFLNLPAGNPNGYKTQQNAPNDKKSGSGLKTAIIAASCIVAIGVIIIVIALIFFGGSSGSAIAKAEVNVFNHTPSTTAHGWLDFLNRRFFKQNII